MTLRTKTVEYAFSSRTSTLSPGTRYDFSAITIFLPENTSRTFRSVSIVHTCRDNETSGTPYITSFMMGVKLGSEAFSDSTQSGAVQQYNSDSHKGLSVISDVTSYFNTNFGSGTSQTCQVGIQWGGIDTINHTAKLIITYEYDDAAQDTRVKTVRIPLDGTSGMLSNTLTELGTNQVPNLDSFLPESGKTYRNIFFEIGANEADQSSSSDFQLALALDSESEVTDGSHEQAMNGSPFYRYVWVRNDMTTNATHAFKARSTVNNRFCLFNVTLMVTYEYDHSASSSIINSLYLPLHINNGFIGYSNENSRYEVKFFVEEANVSLIQSGIYLSFSLATDEVSVSGLQAKIGEQDYRGYELTYSTFEFNKAQFMLSQRLDSGGISGSGLTLARGENTVTLDVEQSSNSDLLASVGAVLILNYTSDKHANGDAVHNHSTCWHAHGSAITSTSNDNSNVGIHEEISSFAPVIPETNYFATNVAFFFYFLSAGQRVPFCVVAEVKPGEGKGDGWTEVASIAGYIASEFEEYSMISNASADYTRHPEDQGFDRLDLETARSYKISTAPESIVGGFMWVTYHSITFTVQGSVSGYSGDGSGITINLYRADNNEFLTSTTTEAGGAFSIVWYDDSVELFCEGREDSTHRGRSDNATAV